MDKPVIKSGVNGYFVPSYPICQGCENLTVGAGWYCAFKPGTRECEYPEKMPPKPVEKESGSDTKALEYFIKNAYSDQRTCQVNRYQEKSAAELAELTDHILQIDSELLYESNQNVKLRAMLEGYQATSDLLKIREEQVGELLEEKGKLRAELDVACHIDAKDKVGFDWAVLTKIEDQRIALDEARNLLECSLPHVEAMVGIASAARGLPEEIAAYLAAHKEVEK